MCRYINKHVIIRSSFTQGDIAIKQSQTVRGRRIDSSSLTMHGEPSPTTSAHPEVASCVGLPHQSPNPCRAHFLWCKVPQTWPLPSCDHALPPRATTNRGNSVPRTMGRPLTSRFNQVLGFLIPY